MSKNIVGTSEMGFQVPLEISSKTLRKFENRKYIVLNFSSDTIANWLAFGSLVVAIIAVFWSIRTDIRTKKATNEKLLRLEDAVTVGFNRLDQKVNEIDKNYQRLKGHLEGVGILQSNKQDSADD